jgi:hypothetical protein
MLTRSARMLAMLAVLGLAAGLAGCGTSLDMAAINKSVSDGITSQLSLTVASTTCPTEAPAAKAGGTFECIVIPKEGGRLTVKVTQSDGKGNVQWEVAKTEGLIDLRTVEQSVVKGLKEQANVVATVSCGGGKFRGIQVGGTFTCQAKSPEKGDATIVVTMSNAEGSISWAVQQ